MTRKRNLLGINLETSNKNYPIEEQNSLQHNSMIYCISLFIHSLVWWKKSFRTKAEETPIYPQKKIKYKMKRTILETHTTGLSNSSIISCACLSLISTRLAGKSASIKMWSGSLRCSYPGLPLSLSSLRRQKIKKNWLQHSEPIFDVKKLKKEIVWKFTVLIWCLQQNHHANFASL